MAKNKKETVLCFGAHGDDLEIAMGGTLAKYSSQGHRVIAVVMTSGEKGNPWLKEEVIVEERQKEVNKIGKFLGCTETFILGLKDGDLEEYIKNKNIINRIESMIRKYRPTKIFVHSLKDAHKDHRAVNEIIFNALKICDKKNKISVFTFEVWNLLNESEPRMYVNINKTFIKKLKALTMFKSQRIYVYILFLQVIVRAIGSGIHNSCLFAERFYKVK